MKHLLEQFACALAVLFVAAIVARALIELPPPPTGFLVPLARLAALALEYLPIALPLAAVVGELPRAWITQEGKTTYSLSFLCIGAAIVF